MRPIDVRMKEFSWISWIYMSLLKFAWIYLDLLEFTWIPCIEKKLIMDQRIDGRMDGQSLL